MKRVTVTKVKNKKPIYYVVWGFLCLIILGISTYPFLSDYFLARKQEAQIAQYEKHGKTSYLDNFYKSPTKKINDPFAKQPKKSGFHFCRTAVLTWFF